MAQQPKSEVELFYEKCSAQVGNPRKFQELSGQEQMMLVQALNLICAVVFNQVQQ